MVIKAIINATNEHYEIVFNKSFLNNVSVRSIGAQLI